MRPLKRNVSYDVSGQMLAAAQQFLYPGSKSDGLLRLVRSAAIGTVLALAAGGCARDPAASDASAGPRVSFDAARARCGVSVVETPEVQRCMRAQGWAYRLPWQ